MSFFGFIMFLFAYIMFFLVRGHYKKLISTLIQKLAKQHISAYGFPPQVNNQ
jgi:hypothetical protein